MNTFVWIENNSIVAVVKSDSEASAWDALQNSNIGIYDRLTRYSQDNDTEVVRPHILEDYTNNCIYSVEEYELL